MYFDDDGLRESGADIKRGEKLPLIVTTRGKWLIFVPSLLAVIISVLFLSSLKEVTQTIQEIFHA